MNLRDLNIALVGLGLMGGSLAMALKGSVGNLVGIDQDASARSIALAQDIIDAAASRLEDVTTAVDMIVLAVPVRSIVSLVRALPEVRPDGCMVLDLGSTKAEIGQAMQQLPDQFSAIGGHPMCGREQSGIQAASADLYQGQTFVFCRNQRTTPDLERVANQIVHVIGANALFMSAEAHDQLVAASSHLPYIVASILMRQAWNVAREDERLWLVSASGLRDTTRLAGSDAQMMLEILLSNHKQILNQVEAYGQELLNLAQQLRLEDENALRKSLDAAQEQRSDYINNRYANDRPSGS